MNLYYRPHPRLELFDPLNFHYRSDDGHFLSDTDDEYNEDFEEWDELGNEN